MTIISAAEAFSKLEKPQITKEDFLTTVVEPMIKKVMTHQTSIKINYIQKPWQGPSFEFDKLIDLNLFNYPLYGISSNLTKEILEELLNLGYKINLVEERKSKSDNEATYGHYIISWEMKHNSDEKENICE